jgi:hypothetical protein
MTDGSPTNHVDVLQRRRRLVIAALAVLALVGAFKGYERQVQTWGVYFWWMDYAYGFSKRGLLGTVFQHVVASGNSTVDLRRISTIHLVACGALVVLLLFHARRMLRATTSARELVIVALAWSSFFASQFLATTINLTGLMDIYLMLAFVGIWDLLRGRRYWTASAVGFLVPFVHEGFTFLWTSAFVVGLFEIVRARTGRRQRLLVTLAPLLGAVLASAFHSSPSPAAALARAPFDERTLRYIIVVQFGQTVLPACQYMLTVFARWWMNFLWASAFYLLPNVIVLLAAAWSWRRSGVTTRTKALRLLVLVVASLSPLLILLLAWDLSRFLVWANLACVIAWERLTIAEPEPEPAMAARVKHPMLLWGLYASSLAIILFYAAAPLVVAFFPEASALRPYPFQDQMVRSGIKHYARPAPP